MLREGAATSQRPDQTSHSCFEKQGQLTSLNGEGKRHIVACEAGMLGWNGVLTVWWDVESPVV